MNADTNTQGLPLGGSRYKLIVLDLDGTLTNSQKQVTPATLDALSMAMDCGAIVVPASGRPTYGVAPIANLLGLDKRGGYVLSFNGGCITDWRTKETVFAKTLQRDIVPVLYDYAMNAGFDIVTYRDDCILATSAHNKYVEEEARINSMRVVEVADFVGAVDFPPAKCMIVGDPLPLARLEGEMAEAMAGKIEVCRSAPYFLELTPKGIDKSLSLMRLLSHLGLSAADMMACGDGYNDLSMIRLAGMGVAMANAMPEVRAAADFVTTSNDDDGVALAVNKFVISAEQ